MKRVVQMIWALLLLVGFLSLTTTSFAQELDQTRSDFLEEAQSLYQPQTQGINYEAELVTDTRFSPVFDPADACLNVILPCPDGGYIRPDPIDCSLDISRCDANSNPGSTDPIDNFPNQCQNRFYLCPNGGSIPVDATTCEADLTLCSQVEPICIAQPDINGDGRVDLFDYAFLVNSFLQTGPHLKSDLNCDQVVDLFDYARLIAAF